MGVRGILVAFYVSRISKRAERIPPPPDGLSRLGVPLGGEGFCWTIRETILSPGFFPGKQIKKRTLTFRTT